jgi:N-acetylglucosamine malate deacetylase 2
MKQRKLLCIFAHPDDESRIVGGALAKYASEGVHITLVVATRGEEGSAGEPPLCSTEELPRVREQELREACRILGISDLEILDYRDGSLPDVDQDELIGRFVESIRRTRPDVVLTFGPEGRTLHPDHLVIHKAATAAFHLAGDPDAYPAHQLPPYTPAKLYYHIVPESIAKRVGWRFPSEPDDRVTLILDIAPWIEQKRQASNSAHRTQAHDLIFKGITDDERWELLSIEHYILAATHGIPRPTREADMFERFNR